MATYCRILLQGDADPLSSSSFLGPWLRALWQAHPDLQDHIKQLAQKHAHLARWQACLQAVCTALGKPAPADLELLPVAGQENVVFRVHSAYVKFFADQAS